MSTYACAYTLLKTSLKEYSPVSQVETLNDARDQKSFLKISFSSCIMGNSTHTDTIKAVAYDMTTMPTKQKVYNESKGVKNKHLVMSFP